MGLTVSNQKMTAFSFADFISSESPVPDTSSGPRAIEKEWREERKGNARHLGGVQPAESSTEQPAPDHILGACLHALPTFPNLSPIQRRQSVTGKHIT